MPVLLAPPPPPPDGTPVRNPTEIELLAGCLQELRRIRLGMQLLVNDPLKPLTDIEDPTHED